MNANDIYAQMVNPSGITIYDFVAEHTNCSATFTCISKNKSLIITLIQESICPLMIVEEDEIDRTEIHGFGDIVCFIEKMPKEWEILKSEGYKFLYRHL